MSHGSCKNCYQQTILLQIIYIYKQDFVLNNLQGWYAVKHNQPVSLFTTFTNSIGISQTINFHEWKKPTKNKLVLL